MFLLKKISINGFCTVKKKLQQNVYFTFLSKNFQILQYEHKLLINY